MHLDNIYSVAIVGDGFAGAAAAISLLRNQNFTGKIILIGPNLHPGRGVAYGTISPVHILNVRAEAMSLFPDTPEHFTDWLKKFHPSFAPRDFVLRNVYGQYVEDTLRNSRDIAKSRAEITFLKSLAIGIRNVSCSQGKWVINTQNGQQILADAVVTALGNASPQATSGLAPSSLDLECLNPWNPTSLTGCDRWKKVILIGTGLTAADTVFELVRRGFNGEMTLISRRGLWPLPHHNTPVSPLTTLSPGKMGLRAMTRVLVSRSRKCLRENQPWQAVMDGIRGSTQELWSSLNVAEQRRFLRHLRPYWDVHRHRMAPEMRDAFDNLHKQKKLKILAGRIRKLSSVDGGQVCALISPRGAKGLTTVLADKVVNCTGPSEKLADRNDPFLSDLISHADALPDSHGIGLMSDDRFHILQRSGKALEGAYIMGTLCRGQRWETTAVRELRSQAQIIADEIVKGISAVSLAAN